MTQEIQPGVFLHVLPTEKFKTVRFMIRFSARHTKDNAGARTLLTSLLETNSQNYPTQTALSSRLAELYGASFGVGMAKKGNLHQVNATLTLVNGKYVGDDALLAQGVAFLREVLFAPNISNGQFDEATFQVEKENMLSYIKSFAEDKQAYASLQLQQLFFKEDADQ